MLARNISISRILLAFSPSFKGRARSILSFVFLVVLLSNMAVAPFARANSTSTVDPDVNGDGAFDILDYVMFALAFGSDFEHPRWNPTVDFNYDGSVDILDMVLLSRAGADAGTSGENTGALTVIERLWSDDSYWYKKIPQNAKLHPESDKMVEWLKNTYGHNYGHPIIQYKSWTKPVYEVYQDTPIRTVYYQGGTKVMFTNVRIPSDAQPATDLDGGLTIIDWYGKKVWDFWRLAYQNGKWTAGDGYGYALYSDGIAPNFVWTCGGSGTPMLGILIRPEEIEAGVINHPLGCALHTPKKGYKVYPPAATTDGRSTNTYAIPEGARIQLDPNLDLDSLGLSRTAKIIAKAMQEYGIVVKESGERFALYAEHTNTADWAKWGLTSGILLSIPAQWRIVDYSVFGAVEQGFT